MPEKDKETTETKPAEKAETPKAEAKPKAAKDDRKAGYYVAEGKSVTSKKGILGPGDGPVDAAYFGGGADTVKRLADAGTLVKVG